ncbi:Vacuolar protein sorting-associated protein 29 [Phytophthora citrophthora]|uniref:Vacuolar protein sorting-associated protein 29 n=1 Tax=Phytophthora citrophthora TaxID=4793 RepID=A0AAD9GQ49_9STRA|nr:Vacuolar protein sorting-associated protein 29 [Phytophthora citrophthora]
MKLVLVVGDNHIPNRASEIPEKFQKMLVPNKMQHVLCTGNLVTKEQFDELRDLAPNVHVVAGDCDQEGVYPETKIVTIGQFRIGLCHGHQIIPWGDQHSLAALQRKMNVDILVTGHTHVSHIRTEQGKWFVNPGSITGAFSSCASDVTPSFMLMALQGPKVVAFLYELKGDNVVVSKSEFTKET